MKRTLHYMLLICFFSSLPYLLTAGGKPDPEIRKELQSYVKQQIVPVLKEHRLQLDKQMTAADRKQVEKLRQDLKKLQSQHEQFRKNNPGHHAELTEEQRVQIVAQQEERKRIYTAASALANKYKSQLESINNSIVPQRTTWDNELKAIVEKQNSETENRRFQKRSHHFTRMLQYRRLLRPVQFILWDVSSPNPPDSFEAANTVAVYPNPSSSSTTISYAVEQAGAVKVTLVNDQGTTVRVLQNEQKTTGAHILDVDVKNLPNGVYFYRIETASGIETLRFLKR